MNKQGIKEKLKNITTRNRILTELYVNRKLRELERQNDEELHNTLNQYLSAEESIDKKRLKRLKKKMIQCRYLEHFMYDEFFYFNFENKSYNERHQYIGAYEAREIFSKLSNSKFVDITKNKYLCYETFKEYFKRDIIQVQSINDLNNYISFCQKHSKYIVKPINGSLGKGIFSVDLTNSDKSIDNHFQDILNLGDSVVEEYVKQSDSMAKYNSTSVNTIRITVFKDFEKINLLYAHIHIGMSTSITSNGSSGGITSIVDLKTGKICTRAFAHNGTLSYYCNHPENGTPILNTQIPRWNELIDLVYEISSLEIFNTIKVVGWDFALTDNGWVIIEGNSCPGLKNAQAFEGQGLRPVFERVNLRL